MTATQPAAQIPAPKNNASRLRAENINDVLDYKAMRLRALKEVPECFCDYLCDEEDKSNAFFAERLAKTHVFAAYNPQGKVAGVAHLYFRPGRLAHIADLGALFVPAEARASGRGYAVDLLSARIAAARQAGCTGVALSVAEHNTRARAIFCEYGFTEYGRLEGEFNKAPHGALPQYVAGIHMHLAI